MIEIFIHMLIIFEICIYIYLPGSCKQSLQWFSIGVSQSPIYIREFPNHLYVWYALCLVDLLMVMMIARRWRWCSPWWKHPNRRWPRCAGCWRLRCSTGKGSGRTGSSWTSCLRPMNEWMISWYWLWPIYDIRILTPTYEEYHDISTDQCMISWYWVLTLTYVWYQACFFVIVHHILRVKTRPAKKYKFNTNNISWILKFRLDKDDIINMNTFIKLRYCSWYSYVFSKQRQNDQIHLWQSPRSSNSMDLPMLFGIVQALQGALR